jgi:hypothetical protein
LQARSLGITAAKSLRWSRFETRSIILAVVSYVYDSGDNAKGHLTSLTDQAGTAAAVSPPVTAVSGELKHQISRKGRKLQLVETGRRYRIDGH